MNLRQQNSWPGNNPNHGHGGHGQVKKMGDAVEFRRSDRARGRIGEGQAG
ncbi:MAG: hypothetical protein ACPLRX_01935 [Candidatus Saccharicenans sp.]